MSKFTEEEIAANILSYRNEMFELLKSFKQIESVFDSEIFEIELNKLIVEIEGE